MKIKALRSLRGDYGTARKGSTLTVSELTAKSLVSRGLAVIVEPKPEKPKAKAEKAD